MEKHSQVIEKLIQSQNNTIDKLTKLSERFMDLNKSIENLSNTIIDEDKIDQLIKKFEEIEKIDKKISELESKFELLNSINEKLKKLEDITHKSISENDLVLNHDDSFTV